MVVIDAGWQVPACLIVTHTNKSRAAQDKRPCSRAAALHTSQDEDGMRLLSTVCLHLQVSIGKFRVADVW
jgi:hypothetical protein